MKLSEISGERVFDVIADIIEPACNIAQDPQAVELFEREDVPDGMTAAQVALGKVRRSVPSLVRTHKDDLVAILAAIEGVEPEKYAREVTIPKLIQGVYEILTDSDLLAFLSSPSQGSTTTSG